MRRSCNGGHRSFPVSALFEETSWRLHPDWMYCQYNYAGTDSHEFATKEDEMRHFMARMQNGKWNWGTPSVIPLPKCDNKETFDPNCMKCKHTLK